MPSLTTEEYWHPPSPQWLAVAPQACQRKLGLHWEGQRVYVDQRQRWSKCYQGQVKWVHSRSNQEISMKCQN